MTEVIKAQTQQGEIQYLDVALKPLLHFDQSQTDKEQTGIPYAFDDYLALVDWPGRAIRHDKRGHIDNNLPPIIVRLNISPQQWPINHSQNSKSFEKNKPFIKAKHR